MRRISTTPGALAIAAALMMILTACTNADNLGGAPEQPGAGAQPTTVRVTVGAGFADDGDAQTRADDGDAQTRSADDAMTRSAVTQSGTARTLTFTAGDKLYVNAHIDEEGRYLLAGFLALDASSLGADGKSASFTGDLSVYDCDDYPPVAATYDFGGATDPLAVCADASAWLVHEGTEADFTVDDSKWGQYDRVPYTHTVMADVSALMTTRLSVRTWGSYDAGARRFGLTASEEAILNCTLGGLTGGQTYSVALETTMAPPFDFSDSETYTGSVTADAGGTARFAILCDAVEGNSYRILLTSVGDADDVVTFDLGQRDLSAKVYNVERNVSLSRIVDLSKLAADYTAQDGDVLTGTAENKNIQIADGASVTLSGVTITDYDYAGITCQGDATITLVGTNSVTNTNVAYVGHPAIQAGPSGTTLEIKGGGSLTATGGGTAAGIGSGNNGTCGDITISGGSLTANGGDVGAGIGSGIDGICGNITISGGNVTATGGANAAGIGSGCSATCGNITISGGTITATGGNYAAGIGSGADHPWNEGPALCVNITISGGSGTAKGGTGSQGDIGAGKESYCGTVSVAPGTINGTIGGTVVVSCQLTLRYYLNYQQSGEMVTSTPAFNVNEANSDITIIVTIDGNDYTATGKYTDGSTVTITLPRVENKTITVTSAHTGYDNSDNPVRPVGGSQPTANFVGTLSGMTITAGSTNNLGTVNLIKQ